MIVYSDYNGGLFDAIGKALSPIGRALDPTRRGSATYATASRLVGEQNLQNIAEVGRAVRDTVIIPGIQAQIQRATGQTVPVQTGINYTQPPYFTPDRIETGTKILLYGSIGLLGLALVMKNMQGGQGPRRGRR